MFIPSGGGCVIVAAPAMTPRTPLGALGGPEGGGVTVAMTTGLSKMWTVVRKEWTLLRCLRATQQDHRAPEAGSASPGASGCATACVSLSYPCGMTRTSTRRLAEVAQKVGLSEATVSRVLNGRAGVSDATREAVLTALDVLGYERPTQLRGVRARLIGLVLPELRNPIFPALAEVIGGALAQRGLTPVLCTRTAGGLSESDYVNMLLDQHVSGMVFAGGHYAEAEHLGYPQVSTDDAVAVEQAYRHLASLGHERIGIIIGPRDHVPSRRKLAAYTAMVERAGRPLVPKLVEHAMFALEGGHAATRRMLQHRVTGIICGSDPLALGAIRAARRADLSVPKDISVVGFDDSDFMTCTEPPLTTVRQPIEALGRAAVSLLMNQIEGASAASDELLFEPELVVRGSTGPAVASTTGSGH